jgi:holin-like protein
MILAVTLLLAFQLAGEIASRALGLSVPGPVLGMALLLVAMAVLPRLAETVRATAQGFLQHLSLLFVPAGVGLVGHLDAFGRHGLAIVFAIVASTALSITVGALVFAATARALGHGDD